MLNLLPETTLNRLCVSGCAKEFLEKNSHIVFLKLSYFWQKFCVNFCGQKLDKLNAQRKEINAGMCGVCGGGDEKVACKIIFKIPFDFCFANFNWQIEFANVAKTNTKYQKIVQTPKGFC